MKQPVNSISVDDVGGAFSEWEVWAADETNIYEIWIASAQSKASALRLAIKRLDRLKRDCERQLAKCERKGK